MQVPSRRREERRDFPRLQIALDVREPHGRVRPCVGDLSPEGASFVTSAPPLGDTVLMRFRLPNFAGPVIAAGRVVGRSRSRAGTQVSVTFTKIELEAELAIAEWLQDRTLQQKAFLPSPVRGPKPILLTKVASRGWTSLSR